jgi:hypothetical protein
MATLTHPSMSKNTPIQEAPKAASQVLVVDDLSAFGSAPTSEPILTPEVKVPINNRLEELLFLGKTTKMVEIAGHTFELSTLTHREHTNLARVIGTTDNVSIFDARALTLAVAIRKIDGLELGTFEERREFIDGMQLKVIEKLFGEYNDLDQESSASISGESLKKS